MRFDIITIFPGFFTGIFDHGVVKRAIATRLAEVHLHDLRAFAHDRHRTVDDRPFGGGEGMVLKPEPLAEAVEHLGIAPKAQRLSLGQTVILLSAQGRTFTQGVARELARADKVVLLCGRYEGVDERVAELIADRELSIGDYVLSGGELGAAVITDATIRLLPGALGNEASSRFESFGQADALLRGALSQNVNENMRQNADQGADRDPVRIGFQDASSENYGGSGGKEQPPRSTYGAGGLLDYPQYTRPAEFRGLAVPAVLSGGNHEQIRRWRRQKALEKTFRNRPDLLQHAELSAEDRSYLQALELRLRAAPQ